MKIKVKFVGAMAIIANRRLDQLEINSNDLTVGEFLQIVDKKLMENKLLDKNGKVSMPCILLVNGKMIMTDSTSDLNAKLPGGAVVTFIPPPAGG